MPNRLSSERGVLEADTAVGRRRDWSPGWELIEGKVARAQPIEARERYDRMVLKTSWFQRPGHRDHHRHLFPDQLRLPVQNP